MIKLALTFLIFSLFSQNLSAQNSIFNRDVAAKNQSIYAVAKINNTIITSSELIDRYKFVLFDSGIVVKSDIEKINIINQILDKMIDEELIRQEAKKYEIKISEEEVKEAITIIMAQKKERISSYKSKLIKNKISYDNFLKQINAEISWSKIASEFLASRIKITDFEINEFIEQNSLSKNYRKVLLGEIFLPSIDGKENKILANKLVEDLRSGADFKTFVKQFSKDSFASDSFGEIGWVIESNLEEKIRKGIAGLEIKQYSNPIFLNNGFYIFKLIDVKNEIKLEDKDINFAKNNLFLKKLQILAKSSLNEIRKNSFIEIDRKKIKNL
jgi:peptidyl-prolyl cis-trans isomerase SurA